MLRYAIPVDKMTQVTLTIVKGRVYHATHYGHTKPNLSHPGEEISKLLRHLNVHLWVSVMYDRRVPSTPVCTNRVM
ncbi:hypothetical protein E2C01_089112 [Portunus trituberculatus]|uniref:Uncharacterized protein n=1 Tax=Portunus trituberculatus TaxID=210409 RepID=A0A5B7JNP5_PORTR|nr:hypothetical protein [Portunus trituberculatus]